VTGKRRRFVEVEGNRKTFNITRVGDKLIYPDDFSEVFPAMENYLLTFEEKIDPKFIYEALAGFPEFTITGLSKPPIPMVEDKQEELEK